VMKIIQFNILTFIKRKSYPPGEVKKGGCASQPKLVVRDCNGHTERAHVICVTYLCGRIYRKKRLRGCLPLGL
jgi:hypothetical protein